MGSSQENKVEGVIQEGITNSKGLKKSWEPATVGTSKIFIYTHNIFRYIYYIMGQ